VARSDIPFSVLDLAVIGVGSHAGAALTSTIKLAQRTEELGYRRFWWPSTTTCQVSPARRPRC